MLNNVPFFNFSSLSSTFCIKIPKISAVEVWVSPPSSTTFFNFWVDMSSYSSSSESDCNGGGSETSGWTGWLLCNIILINWRINGRHGCHFENISSFFRWVWFCTILTKTRVERERSREEKTRMWMTEGCCCCARNWESIGKYETKKIESI